MEWWVHLRIHWWRSGRKLQSGLRQLRKRPK